MNTRSNRNASTLAAIVLLAGCGGGGSSSPSGVVVPSTPTPGPRASSTPVPATSLARITIVDPAGGAGSSAVKRRPSHLPATARTITVSANGAPAISFPYAVNGPTCVVSAAAVTTCTFDAAVPTGADSIVVQALNQTGKLLSTATVQQTVSGTTIVPVTLLGVPVTGSIKFGKSTAPVGTPATVALTLTVTDADFNPIAGTYSKPVSLTDSDTAGDTAISPNPVADSTTPISMTYDGKALNVRITVGLPGAGSAAFASALPAREFAIPSGTLAQSNAGTGTIVQGGDGAMWFGEQNGVGRITTAGAITEFPMVQPQQMVRGADGAVWFTTYSDSATGQFGELCRVDPTGTVTKFNVNVTSHIVLGADGNFWTADGHSYVRRITPAGGTMQFPLVPPAGALNPGVQVSDVVARADGNLNILDDTSDVVYTVTTAGTQLGAVVMSPFPVSGGSLSPAVFGPDGAIWYTSQNALVRITQAGATTEFTQLPGPFNAINGIGFVAPIITGPDNNLWTTGSWFGQSQSPAVFRVVPASGAAIALPLPTVPVTSVYGQPNPGALATGPGGTIWYTRGATVGVFTPPT
ncbi:MAG: hypothetical protein JWN27_3244 [Candidatus Eremiobacteraeota bacterium]|nr:hypothetical protein [Candidatus Eremiobacteraeota bacterium]